MKCFFSLCGVEFKQVFDKLRENNGFELDTWSYGIFIHVFRWWSNLGTNLSNFKYMEDS